MPAIRQRCCLVQASWNGILFEDAQRYEFWSYWKEQRVNKRSRGYQTVQRR